MSRSVRRGFWGASGGLPGICAELGDDLDLLCVFAETWIYRRSSAHSAGATNQKPDAGISSTASAHNSSKDQPIGRSKAFWPLRSNAVVACANTARRKPNSMKNATAARWGSCPTVSKKPWRAMAKIGRAHV